MLIDDTSVNFLNSEIHNLQYWISWLRQSYTSHTRTSEKILKVRKPMTILPKQDLLMNIERFYFWKNLRQYRSYRIKICAVNLSTKFWPFFVSFSEKTQVELKRSIIRRNFTRNQKKKKIKPKNHPRENLVWLHDATGADPVDNLKRCHAFFCFGSKKAS